MHDDEVFDIFYSDTETTTVNLEITDSSVPARATKIPLEELGLDADSPTFKVDGSADA